MSQRTDFTVGVVTALPKEFSAVRAVFNCPVDPTAGRTIGGRRYLPAVISARDRGQHDVVITMLPEMGNNAAAIRAAQLLVDFPTVKHLLMVGIAGAVPNPSKAEHHVRLGDIVVSGRDGVQQYDLVKDSGGREIEHRNSPRPPSRELIEALNWLKSDEDFEKRPWEEYVRDGIARLDRIWERPGEDYDVLKDLEDDSPPTPHPADPARRPGYARVFVGPVGAANVLLKNVERRNEVRDRFGVKAIEMEGSGIADAAWDAQIGYMVVRGTCDYCNRHKNDAWQKHAAILAAGYARALIELLPSGYTEPSHEGGPEQSKPVGLSITEPALKFLYEKGFEHGKLAGGEVRPAAPSSEEVAAIAFMAREQVSLTPGDEVERTSGPDEPVALVTRLMEHLQGHLDVLEYELAARVARELEALLVEREAALPGPVRRTGYELLAGVEIINIKRARQDGAPSTSTARARDFLKKARDGACS